MLIKESKPNAYFLITSTISLPLKYNPDSFTTNSAIMVAEHRVAISSSIGNPHSPAIDPVKSSWKIGIPIELSALKTI